jgi:quercetin dioxygenase-like cupin family protein
MRKNFLSHVAAAAALVFGLALAAGAQAPAHHLVVPHDKIAWGPILPVFPPGAEMAVIQGNPFGDGFYVVRVRMPGGYKIMPHWHPAAENVTVLSGTMYVGAGDTFDESKGDKVAAGGYFSLPSLMHHFAWSEGPTEIQIHGVAPFAIIYVNPADDPSHTQK